MKAFELTYTVKTALPDGSVTTLKRAVFAPINWRNKTTPGQDQIERGAAFLRAKQYFDIHFDRARETELLVLE